MIAAPMERTVGGGERRAYVSAVADLWERVGAALSRLERIAESPAERLTEEVAGELPSLQYHLHAGSELALGIAPPPGAEAVHEELVAALGQARDATAQVAFALEAAERELVEQLLPEWRGALFRVRLARLRALERFPLTPPAKPERPAAAKADGNERTSPALAFAPTVLVIGGALLITAGAVLAAWPV